MIAGPVSHNHALWRHPDTQLDFLQPETDQQIAQILETGKFDLLFFADRLAVSEGYGQSFEVGVRYGDQDAARLDPIPLLAAIAPSRSISGWAQPARPLTFIPILSPAALRPSTT
ncbi:MAG: hypothetical protein OHK0035_31220 [Cyanobacteria bacterium J069]